MSESVGSAQPILPAPLPERRIAPVAAAATGVDIMDPFISPTIAQRVVHPRPSTPHPERIHMPVNADSVLVGKLVAANRILARYGIVDGFGHVSMRMPGPEDGFLLSRSLAPASVRSDDIMRFGLDGNALDGDARTPYLERFIHGEIYRARSDVQAVVHNHSPSVIPFGATRKPLRPLYHMSAFIGNSSAFFEIRDAGGNTDMLVRDRPLGGALARALGAKSVVLMRGHGCTVVGESVEQVVYRSIYTEMNAKLQLQAVALGEPEFLNDEEADKATRMMENTLMRSWNLWVAEVGPIA
jgi:HCOMODA/2-hydroxy-3-carboxy-muconic semialdehyde decarboxylase